MTTHKSNDPIDEYGYNTVQARPARITVEFLDEDKTYVFECDNVDLCRHNLIELAPVNGSARNDRRGVGSLTILAYTKANRFEEE